MNNSDVEVHKAMLYIALPYGNTTCTRIQNFNNLDNFKKYLIVPNNDGDIEIPYIIRGSVEKILNNNLDITSGKGIQDLKIVSNLKISDSITLNSFNDILKIPFRAVGLTEVTLKRSNNVYYVGKGIILDNELKPLMLMTLKAKEVHDNNTYKIVYYDSIMHINSELVNNTRLLINRNIVHRIIPYFIHNPISIRSKYGIIPTFESPKGTVVIGKIDSFFKDIEAPKCINNIQESLNDCIVDNIDTIINTL